MGRRLGEAPRFGGLRGARHDERRVCLGSRKARPTGHSGRVGRARGGAGQGDDLPLNVDSERCYPDDPGGIAETVALLADAGAAGFSIEDYDPAAGGIDEVDLAATRVALAAEASRALPEPLVLTGRAENHIRGVDDLDDTIARLIAYRDAGADAVYAPGLTELEQIAAVVEAVGVR